jgi:hypothetical protein
MSPGFRNVLRFAGVPVDSAEPVRRKYGSRMIGIVTLCLLRSWCSTSRSGFHFIADYLGAGVYIGLSVAGDNSGIADALF